MSGKIRLESHDDQMEGIEPTDSEAEYSEEEKELLANVRKGRRRNQDDQELFAFSDSDDGDDDDDDEADDPNEFMRNSDIEGAGDDDGDGLVDTMDWGDRRSNYYSTDFVDKDYSSYNAQEEEQAKAEEEEARKIQQRLANQMNEADYGLDSKEPLDSEDDSSHKQPERIKVDADLSGLSQRDLLQLFLKDSPEFIALTKNFKDYLGQIKTLTAPVATYVQTHDVPAIPALKFAHTYEKIQMTYCANVAYYLLLKVKRVEFKQHPVVRRLVQLKQLLEQLQDKYESLIKPQLEALLERIEDGDDFNLKPMVTTKSRKLQILNEYNTKTEKKARHISVAAQAQANGHSSSTDDDDDDDAVDGHEEEGSQADGNDDDFDVERRAITYQIAKNKGLTPHRKKEQRNPRVKHRGKYKKALVRRKGAVRTVRNETQRYGGEISGIKSTVSKSIKFKS